MLREHIFMWFAMLLCAATQTRTRCQIFGHRLALAPDLRDRHSCVGRFKRSACVSLGQCGDATYDMVTSPKATPHAPTLISKSRTARA